jgi:hypothetical protein
LTPGELLVADQGSQFNACGGLKGHCVVFGLEPGAIDSVEAFLTGPDNGPTGTGSPTISHAYSFRCAVPTAQ